MVRVATIVQKKIAIMSERHVFGSLWCIHSIQSSNRFSLVTVQACEFDYSGTQACKALKAEGYRIILLNSNPVRIYA